MFIGLYKNNVFLFIQINKSGQIMLNLELSSKEKRSKGVRRFASLSFN